MKSRSASAAAFAVLFSFLFVFITFFVPSVDKIECGGQVQRNYEFFGVSSLGFSIGSVDPACTGGTVKQGTGFPFATRNVESAVGTLQPVDNPQLDLNVPGVIGNFIVFWFVAFFFFFIFVGGTGNTQFKEKGSRGLYSQRR